MIRMPLSSALGMVLGLFGGGWLGLLASNGFGGALVGAVVGGFVCGVGAEVLSVRSRRRRAARQRTRV